MKTRAGGPNAAAATATTGLNPNDRFNHLSFPRRSGDTSCRIDRFRQLLIFSMLATRSSSHEYLPICFQTMAAFAS